MKVAVSSTGTNLNSQVDPHFGRCPYFIIIKTDDMSFEVFDNENINMSGGAGIQSGSFIASKGVNAVLTGNCGPKAMQTLVAAEIEVFTGHSGTVNEAVEKFKQGELMSTTKANALEKSGVSNAGAMGGGSMGGGGGRGMGGGGGRGMGGGGGRGMGGGGRCMGGGIQSTGLKDTDVSSKMETISLLKKQAEELKKQMDNIESKIKSLE